LIEGVKDTPHLLSNFKQDAMNRRKKSIQIVKARIKKAKAKLSTNKKPKYISKAERARLEAETKNESDNES